VSLALEAVRRLGEIVIPTLLLISAFSIVGGAVRRLARRHVAMPHGLAPAIAFGIATAALVLMWAHFLGIPLQPVSWVLLAASTLVLVVGWIRDRRAAPSPLSPTETPGSDAQRSRWPRWATVDLAALGVSGLVLSPLMRHGATYWTNWANDFPSYIGYTQAWLAPGTGPGSYLYRHPDPFGAYMAFNADLDKLSVTGMLAFAESVTQVPVYLMLTPVVWLLIALTLALITRLIRRLWAFPRWIAFAIAMISTFSIVPFTRILDNQLGQGLLVALVFTALLTLAHLSREASRTTIVATAMIAALALAAAIGSNYATLLAFAPVLGCIVIGIMIAKRLSIKASIGSVALCGSIAILILIPLAPGVVESLGRNLSGTIGQQMAFPSALALIGQQVTIEGALSPSQTAVTWIGALFIGLALLWTSCLSSPLRSWTTVATALTIANIGVVMARVGQTNYGTHKWTSLFLIIMGPLLLAGLAERLKANRSVIGGLVYGYLAIISASIAFLACVNVPFVIPRDLVALANDPMLGKLDTVNINLGNYYEDAFAAGLIPSRRLSVVGSTYARGSAPTGSTTLRRSGTTFGSSTQKLSVPSYVLEKKIG
jgi:hypothetical protein